MTGPISYGNDRHISGGGTSTDFDFHAGKVAIRLSPENAVGNDISRCVNIRDTGTGALYPIATATPPQVFDLPITAGYEDQLYQNTYYKTQDGIVHVSFCIRKTTSTAFDSQEVFATLPAGFRPSSELARDVGGDGINLGNGIVATEIHIRTNGEMYIWGVNFQINWVYGEVSFLAAD